MEPLVVIRYYKPGDERMCKEIIKTAAMSTVSAAFLTGLTTELHFQVMVLASAVMYIFLGVPFGVCLASIPAVIVLMYILVYITHVYKAHGTMEQFNNIPRNFMSSDSTGFWVAELYEPSYNNGSSKQIKYDFVSEADVTEERVLPPKQHKRMIIGTMGLIGDLTDHIQGRSAWIQYLAVLPPYRRRGVASALLKTALMFATEQGYGYITLSTSECHHAARMFFLKRGFELKQTYHKHIVGSLVKVLKYELTKDFHQKDYNLFPESTFS